MYLIERILGVSLYSVVLLLVFVMLKRGLNTKSISRILNIYIFILCVMAFFFVPNKGSDLYRILYMTRNWYQYSFGEFFQTRVVESATPVAELMMYFCSFLRSDGWLPALSCFIFFNNYFYILKDLNKRHNVNSSSLAYSLLFLMSTGVYLEVISGVRCFSALSIISRCCYDELYNEKKFINNIPFALLASLMHSMALVVYYLWIIYSVLRKDHSRTRKVMSVVGLLGVGLMAIYFGRAYVATAIDKAVAYLGGNKVYTYFWEYLIGWIVLLVLITVMWKIKKNLNLFQEVNLYRFNMVLIILECIISFEYNTFHRLMTMSLLMSAPIICKYVNVRNNNQIARKNNVLIMSLLILFLACLRGNLSSYKFFII